MRRVTRTAIEHYALLLEEVFPAGYLAEHELLPIQDAVPPFIFRPIEHYWRKQSDASFIKNCSSCKLR